MPHIRLEKLPLFNFQIVYLFHYCRIDITMQEHSKILFDLHQACNLTKIPV